MEEILQKHAQDISKFAEEFVKLVKENVTIERGIYIVANEMFSNKITIYQIAFFLAFAEKVIELYPCKRRKIFKHVFTCLYRNIKF